MCGDWELSVVLKWLVADTDWLRPFVQWRLSFLSSSLVVLHVQGKTVMAGIFPTKWKYKKGHKWLQVFYWLTIRYLFVQTFSLAFLLHGQRFSSRKCVSGRSTFPPQWLLKKKSEIFILGRKTIISVVMFQIKDIVWYQAHDCPPKTIKCDEICMFGWRFLHNMNEEKGRICIQCLIPWGRDYNRKQESPSVWQVTHWWPLMEWKHRHIVPRVKSVQSKWITGVSLPDQ